MQEIPIGAHLLTPRLGYTHHGIYAGGGRVIHYAGFGRLLRRGPVAEVPLERFTRGRGIALKNTAAPKYAGAAAVERARSRIGEDHYRLWPNNCEHFVNWSLSGESTSMQAERWRARLFGPVRAASAWLGARDRRQAPSSTAVSPNAAALSFQLKPAHAGA